DVWSLSLAGNPGWTQVRPAGASPSERAYHTAIFDPVRDRVVVFGGIHGDRLNEVWTLSLTGDPTWTLLTPNGTPPSARYLHTAIYDPVRDRMLVFGGFALAGLNDVWELSLSGTPTWTQLTPAGTPPSAREGPTAIYDPVRDRMLVFGGYSAAYLNDVWELSLAGSPAWTQL